MTRKILELMICLLCMAISAAAKDSSGIYMNTADYNNGKLSYATACNGTKQNNRIHVHDFFWNMPGITLKHEGRKYRFRKSGLYGYTDCNNNVYRFYDNTEYLIADAGGIYIYSKDRNAALSKGYAVVNDYYFSVAAGSEIMPLTLRNLERAYGGNHRFLDLLDEYCRTGALYEYDHLNKTFRINRLFSKTLN